METSGFTPSGKMGTEYGKMTCATATAARHRRPAHRRLGEFDLLSVASYPTIMAPDTMLFPQSSVSLSGTRIGYAMSSPSPSRCTAKQKDDLQGAGFK